MPKHTFQQLIMSRNPETLGQVTFIKSLETSIWFLKKSALCVSKLECFKHVGILLVMLLSRAVARSENPGGLVVLGGDNVRPLIEIGLTELPKIGGLKPPSPHPPLATGLSWTTLNTGEICYFSLSHSYRIVASSNAHY